MLNFSFCSTFVFLLLAIFTSHFVDFLFSWAFASKTVEHFINFSAHFPFLLHCGAFSSWDRQTVRYEGWFVEFGLFAWRDIKGWKFSLTYLKVLILNRLLILYLSPSHTQQRRTIDWLTNALRFFLVVVLFI